MLSWQDMYTKAQRLTKDNNSDTLIQLKQDMNTGYHMFNAKLGRYFTRKQQFTNLIANQQIYQIPVDCVHVMGMTALVTSAYEPTIKEVREEYQWRQIVSVKTIATNWPTYYFMIGSDEFALWPIPSQNITNGLRFYYQPQDHDLTLDDTTSTTTALTVTVTNGSPTVTASGSAFNADMAGLMFQETGVTDTTWYQIESATATTLTLKSNFVGISGAGKNWRIGQVGIIPQEYQDAPMHYALFNYFSAQGSEARGMFHFNQYETLVTQCLEDYSSSNESNVIDDSDNYLNPWMVPPIPMP